MSDRKAALDAFLNQTEWADSARVALASDASTRCYLRLKRETGTAILMDAPPANGEDTASFVKIAQFLNDSGLAAPRILAHDGDAGLLLLGDLGTMDYAQWLAKTASDETTLYQAAADVLLKLETVAPPAGLKRMTPDVGAAMIDVLGHYYTRSDTADLQKQLKLALDAFAPETSTLALRDYHAENLIWRSERHGLDRVGLLDFQDAFVAPAGYDLASLLRDARRDVSPRVAEDIIAYFEARTTSKGQFRISLACLGVQRNLRILGVFARLATTMGKPRYLEFMPRVWNHILNDLHNPALAALKQSVLDTVPAPTSDHLRGLQS